MANISLCLPPVTCGDSPLGHAAALALRRHLRCIGFPMETLLTLRCGPNGPCCHADCHFERRLKAGVGKSADRNVLSCILLGKNCNYKK